LFSITPSGSYKIIWHFGLTNGDCNAPYGALTYVPNEKALYGLAAGGTDSYGCIFKWNIAKKSESVVYSFTTPSGNPNGGLVFYKDALYGTTEEGGVYGAGSVFKVTLSGRFNTIHSFSASAKSKKFAGGHYPLSALTVVGDTFYGTTELGGKSQVGACGSAGCGTIFKMTPGGKETVLHDFLDTSQGDGIEPQSPITEINGTLYGTAPSGGAGYGIIYALSPSGSPAYHVFFTFTDGSGYPLIPLAPVISIGGNLYGTTQRGGVACPGYGDFGCGTVYAVPLSSK